MSKRDGRGKLIAGIILIIIGIAILLRNLGFLEPGIFAAAIGASFLVAYAFRRLLGFLIPGMILLWLGVASILTQSHVISSRLDGPVTLTALGLSFILIYVFMGRRRHWWPLVPGGILFLVGAVGILSVLGILPLTLAQLSSLILPIVLIIVGVWLIFEQWRKFY